MKSILIFIIILQICFVLYNHCNSFEHFNIQQVPPGDISNTQFAHMFERVVLPSADELSEMGGRYEALEGIESPKTDLSYSKNNASMWIGVD